MQTMQMIQRGDGFGSTQRIDPWWMTPAATAIGLLVFFGYLTELGIRWRSATGRHGWALCSCEEGMTLVLGGAVIGTVAALAG